MARTAVDEPWTPDELRFLHATRELHITAARADGSRSPSVPIWVVVVGESVFVRTWQRRTTGWYGRAVASGRASITVSGEPVEVIAVAVGEADAAAVDAAYRAKYGSAGAESMVAAEAAASTLRLTRRGRP